MQAIRVHQFGGPEVMKIEELPSPLPSKGEIVIDLKAAGVNPVDHYVRSGKYAWKPKLPYTPGFDGAGVIKVVGEKVRKFSIGDRVYIADSLSGTYAQEVLCREDQVHVLPKKLTFEQGAGIFVAYITAYRALFQRGQAKEKESVLIHGASGGVGIAAIQLAKSYGLEIYGTAGTKQGEELIKKEGADHVFNHHDAHYRKKIFKKTDEKGIDLVLEMLADVNLNIDIELLARNGRILVIGCRGPAEINPRGLMKQDSQILGVSVANISPKELDEIHKALQKGFQKGDLLPVIGERFTLEEASLAHQKIMEPGAYGKIILTI